VRTVAAAIEAELRLRQLHTAAEASARRGTVRVLRTGRTGGTRRPATAGPGAPRLRLLGHPHGQLITAEASTPLRLRHAEILLLLTLHPDGLTAEQLAVQLHDRRTAAVTQRAELSRLRDLLARSADVTLASRPYRLQGGLDTDVAAVRRLLHRGAYRRALAAYPGPVLPQSQAPGVGVVRERLRRELRACLIAGGDADLLWSYAQTPEAGEDLEIWQACLRALPASSRRAPVVSARVHQLHDDLG
jgi:hypothetical protein